MTHQLIFLMPKIDGDFFATKNLLERQDLYISALQSLQGRAFSKGLLLYSGPQFNTNNLRISHLEAIRLCSSDSSLLFFTYKSFRTLKRLSSHNFIFVAGTPFQHLLAARLLKVFFPKAKIQVSIHGEIAGVKSNRFKSWFFQNSIHKVDAIRFVSKEQQSAFLEGYPISNIPNSVTPVPIELSQLVIRKNKVRSIGFVGRIHEERDPLLWASIVESLPGLKKIVVGEGPLRDQLFALIPHASFRGRLEGEELSRVWEEIGVLLSAAPFESYGLALREALLNGVPVVARTSAGSRDLSEKFPNLVKTYDSKAEAISHVAALIENPPTGNEYSAFREWFETQQNSSLASLATLWNSIGK